MAEIAINCPACGDKRTVSDDLAGKKIKCQKCQAIFPVKAPPKAAPAPAAKQPAKPVPAKPAARAAKPVKAKEEEEDANPYTMRDENLSIRCPFCAQLLEPPDAKICLHCGYDMIKRRRVESKQVYHQTGGDYLKWHLTTIAAFTVIFAITGFDVWCVMNMSGWLQGSFFEDVAGGFSLWIVVISLFVIFLCGRFAIRKLVWRFHPPEKEVRKSLDYDEEVL